MKRKLFLVTIAFITLVAFTSCSKNKRKIYNDGKTPVERYGKLHVDGTFVCGEDGKPVQICGMSSHGLQWYGKFANKDVIQWLRDDWNCDLYRPAMYLGSGGYAQNGGVIFKMIDAIEASIELGMYVLVDWHVLPERDPLVYVDKAEQFFERIAKEYGDKPNVIFEICNEPNGDDITWEDNIKPFAERIIPIIRKYSDNIIVVGTPRWSSDLFSVLDDRLEGENIMYTYHFYAGTTGQDGRNGVKACLEKGLPVFVTEWGTTQASGDGGVFEESTMEWVKFMADNKLCWANWSINNKGEDSGVLKYGKDKDAKGGWTEADLQPSGILLRQILRGEK